MGFLKKAFKKIGKGIKKVAKKVTKVTKNIWKGIKKAGGKVMKAISKAGIVGQLGLMLVMPYAMAGIGSLIGGAAGGLSATWTGFGNWASGMMGSSNAFAQAVGGIAKGVYHAGATAGKLIKGVASFIDTGFKTIAQKTGLPNPIEGFSSAVKSGYTKSFAATNNFLFGGTDIQATASQLRAAGVTDTSFTDKFLQEATAPKLDEKGFNIEKLESLQQGDLSGQIYNPTGTVTYNDATGIYTDSIGVEFTADLDGNFTQVGGFKFGEFNMPKGGYTVTPEMATEQLTSMGIDTSIPQVGELPTRVNKFGQQIKDFAVSKAGDYINKYVDNKINNSIYGEQDTDTSIGFSQWEEIGRGIDVVNFFKKGDSYTPSLAAFYDDAENVFGSRA
jgi:hypothetical protein